MVLSRIYRKILELLLVVVLLVLLVLSGDSPEKKWQEARKILTSIHVGGVTSFRIHPEFSNPPDYNNAIEFDQEEELVMAFFQAITDSQLWTLAMVISRADHYCDGTRNMVTIGKSATIKKSNTAE